jgi:hypothetical protein
MKAFCESRSTEFSREAVVLIAVVAAFVLLTTAPVNADHLEGKQQALGRPEHMLSGIDVYKTTIAEVIKKYSEPTSKRNTPAEGVKDGVGGYRDYIWEIRGLRLLAGTGYHNDHESGVYSVDVWGTSPNEELGKSGRGLTLGSTLQQQKALYGDRFFISSTYGKMLPSGPDPKGKVKSVLLEWHDGTQMVIDYDSNGRISHMQLSANIE